MGLAGLEFYGLNPTRLAIKKKFITQPNLRSPKNRPNLAGWVGSVLAGWLYTPTFIFPIKMMSKLSKYDLLKNNNYPKDTYKV